MVKKLIIVLASLFVFIGNADVLHWQVDSSSIVHYDNGTATDLYTFLTPVPWTAEDNKPKITDASGNVIGYGDGMPDAIVAARINVCDAQGNVLRTLENIHGNVVDDSWKAPIDIGHPNSPNGVGADAKSSNMNNNINNLSEYYQVAILKKVQGDWNAGIFEEIAWSGLYSGNLLDESGNFILSDNPEAVAALTAWIPQEYYTYRPVPVYDYTPAPEPTTLVLMLLGIGVISLRRKT